MGSSPRTRGNAAAYGTLLAKVYAALKAVDPEIIVLGGAMSGLDEGWASRLFQTGALNNMDGFSVHPYVYPDVPEKAVLWLDRLEAIARRSAGGREVPIYVTEIGWPTHQGTDSVEPTVAADYLARFYLLAPMRSFIKGASWYDLFNDGLDVTDREFNFGLFTVDWSPKPASCAMAEIGKLLASYKPVSANQDSNGVWVGQYSNGQDFVYALWTQYDSRCNCQCNHQTVWLKRSGTYRSRHLSGYQRDRKRLRVFGCSCDQLANLALNLQQRASRRSSSGRRGEVSGGWTRREPLCSPVVGTLALGGDHASEWVAVQP